MLFLLVGACSFFVAYKVSHVPQTSESQASPQTSDGQCDPTLWQYVYHPARLQVLGDSCISVTGSVEDIRKEADDDLHILFQLDQQFESLLNEKNMSRQHGDLALEPICQGTIRQADATEPCSRYNGPYFEPQIGQRYLVSGTYVHDVDHGWNEWRIAIVSTRLSSEFSNENAFRLYSSRTFRTFSRSVDGMLNFQNEP